MKPTKEQKARLTRLSRARRDDKRALGRHDRWWREGMGVDDWYEFRLGAYLRLPGFRVTAGNARECMCSGLERLGLNRIVRELAGK